MDNSNTNKEINENAENKQSEENLSGNAEKFVLEYPKNYNEIVERKLQMLEREYADTVRCDMKMEEIEAKISNSDEESEDGEASVKDDQNREGYTNLAEENENQQYQCLNEQEDEEFVEVNEDCKNEETNYIGSHIYAHVHSHNQCVEEDFEFISKSEDANNIPSQNVEFIVQNQSGADANSKPYVPRSPIKDAEKIKNAMKKVKMNPPKWAEKYIFYTNLQHFSIVYPTKPS